MTRRSELRTLLPVLVFALVAGACGGGESALQQARQEDLAALEELKTALDGKRDELSGAREELTEAEEAAEMGGEAPEGEDGGARLMLSEGAFENPRPDVAFGLHVGNAPLGTLGYRTPAEVLSDIPGVALRN